MVLVAGPHVIRVARAGFVPYDRTVDVAAGGETRFAVDLVPTLETRQRAEDRTQTRRIGGWSAVGGGVALAAGAAIYAIATRHDISNAQAALDRQLALEANHDLTNHCSNDPANLGTYMFFNCGQMKASLQDQVDSARLRRDLAYAGIGVGVVAAGLGTYLLATTHAGGVQAAGSSSVGFWSDGRGAGLVAFGHY